MPPAAASVAPQGRRAGPALDRHSRASTPSLRRCGRRGNPPRILHARKVEASKQRSELHSRKPYAAAGDRWPAERATFQLLPDQHQPSRVPVHDFHPVAAFGSEHQHHARERVLAQHLSGQRRQRVGPLAKINRLACQQYAHASRDGDHDPEARTARNTTLSSSGSTPGETRTTAPANATSSIAPDEATSAADGSATIGTKPKAAVPL